MASFACTTSSGGDLCFFGGVCMNQTACVCPDGFGADRSLFFQPNCALPAPAFAVIFGVATLTGLPLSVITVFELSKRKKRTLLTDAAWSSLLMMVLLWATTLAMYIDNGLFVAGSVLFGISISFAAFWANVCVRLLLRAVSMTVGQTSSPKLHMVTSSTILLWIACGVAMAVTSLWDDDYSHNIIVCVLYVGSTLTIGTYTTLFRARTIELLKLLSETQEIRNGASSHVNMQDVIARVQKFKSRSGWGFIGLCFAMPAYPIVYLALGSFPFIWLLNGNVIITDIVFVGGSTVALLWDDQGSTKKTSSSATTVSSKQQSVRVVVA